MLTIRFNRVGKRNKAYFRVVLQEHVIAPGGRHVEILGSYDPHAKKAVLKADRIKYWIGKGAQPSDTAFNLFIKEGIIEGKKRAVKIPKKAEEPQTNADGVQTNTEKTESKAKAPKTEEPKVEEKKEDKKEEKPKEEKKEENIDPALNLAPKDKK